MAIFEIKPADSVIAFGDAFSYDSPDPDTLIVDAGAFLFLDSRVWRRARQYWHLDRHRQRIDRRHSPRRRTLKEGRIFFDEKRSVIDCTVLKRTITNSGTIAGGLDGINAGGAGLHIIKNSGTISGGFAILTDDNGTYSVTNSGVIKGYVLFGSGGGGGDDTFFDFAKVGHKIISGTIQGAAVDLGGGNDKFFGGSKYDAVCRRQRRRSL